MAGFIKRTIIHCYIKNMKALGLVVSEKIFFYVFSMMPSGPCPRGTVGRIYQRTFIHSYIQNRKALGLVVFGEEDFFYVFSHCKSMGANDPRGGAIFDPSGMVGRIYKEDHYTLLHTKYESSGPCGFREEDFFYVFPMTPLGQGLYGLQGHGWQGL